MPGHNLQTLCLQMKLGDCITSTPLSGGFLHQLWRVQTTQGQFVLKLMGPQTPELFASIQYAEHIAAHHREHAVGFQVIAPKLFDAKPCFAFDQYWWQCFPWIEGNISSLNAVHAEQATRMAAVLAHLHQTNVWQQCEICQNIPMERPTAMTINWAALSLPTPSVLVLLNSATERYNHAMMQLEPADVLSHGDLYQRNVIWNAEGLPVLIDWEGARRINARIELLGLALNWAGITTTMFDETIFQQIITDYQKLSKHAVPINELVINAGLGSWLQWFYFNYQRVQGEQAATSQQRHAAKGELVVCLRVLNKLLTLLI